MELLFFKDKKEGETAMFIFAFGSYFLARETVWKLYCLIVCIDKVCTSKSTVVLCIGMDDVLANHACTFKYSTLHFRYSTLTLQDDS